MSYGFGSFGRDFGFGVSCAGTPGTPGGGTLDPALPVPFLSLEAGATDYPPVFLWDIEPGYEAGDQLELPAATSYANLIADNLLNSASKIQTLSGSTLNFGLAGITSPAKTFARARLRRGSTYGPWGNYIVHGDIVAPTITSSATWTITADNLLTYQLTADEAVLWSIVGGDDQAKFSVDASTGVLTLLETPTALTQSSYDVDVRATDFAGLFDTDTLFVDIDIVFPTPTAPPATSDLLAWFTAADLSKMFQSNAGATAVAADGDVVGTWNDSSGAGFNLTATGNDSTRPVYKTTGGLNRVQFDGSNDRLVRAASLGHMQAGNDRTLAIALRPLTPTAGDRLLSENNTGAGNNLYNPICAGSSPADHEYYIRDGSFGTKSGTFTAGALANNTLVVIMVEVDDIGGGSYTITPYKDGVAGTPLTDFFGTGYTFNHFSLGALYSGGYANHFECDVFGMCVYNRKLTNPEKIVLTSYLGGLQGRTI